MRRLNLTHRDQWQARVRTAARIAEFVAFMPGSGPRAGIVDRYLRAVDPAVRAFAADADGAVAAEHMTFGLLVGYALAKTEAGDDPESWAQRALRFIGGPVPGVIPDARAAERPEERDDPRPLAGRVAEFDALAERDRARQAAEDARRLPTPGPELIARAEDHARRMGWIHAAEASDPVDLARTLGHVLEGETPPLEILRLQVGLLAGAEAGR